MIYVDNLFFMIEDNVTFIFIDFVNEYHQRTLDSLLNEQHQVFIYNLDVVIMNI